MTDSNWRRCFVAFATVLLLCAAGVASADELGGPPAGAPGVTPEEALDDEPAPPAPPEVPGEPETEQPMTPDEPAADDPAPDDGAADVRDPCDFPPPAPRAGCWEPCAPSDPCDPCAPDPCGRCCFPTDVCGWDVDSCGRRLGKTEIVIEALFTLYDEMDGLVGLAAPAPALSWNPSSYDGEIGGRVTLRYALTPKDKIEARGAWYGEAEGTSSQFGSIGSAPPAGNVLGPVTATLTTQSELLSAETNWWRRFCCKGRWRFSGSLGIRYIGLEETARGDTFLGAAAPVPGFFQSSTNTDFLAGQLGAAAHYTPWKNFEVGLIGKALLGSMRRNLDVTDDSIFVGGMHAATSEKTEFGFGAEFELALLWRLNRRIALTGGYALLFLNDIVRADDALDFSQGGTGAVQAQQKTSAYLNHSIFAGFQFNL